MNKVLYFKKIVSISFFAAFVAVFLSAGSAQASFWDWLNLNKTSSHSQQSAATANADTISAPSNFTAETGACGSGSINLNWNKVSAANQYRVKKTDLSNIDHIISLGNISSYTDSSVLNENLTFKYSVAACNGTDCSAYSNSVSANSPSKCGSSNSSSSSSSSSSAKSSSSSVSTGSSSSSSSVQQYTLKVKISGAGQISGGGINCKKSAEGKYSEGGNWACNVKVNKGAEVTLYISEPSAQYSFATWADDCRSFQKATSCNFKMNGDKTVSATFNKKAGSGENTATVSVRKTGSGVGKVVSIVSAGKNSGKEDGAINCGNNCSENYKQYCENSVEGDRRCGTAYFKAIAEKGSTFSGWGGDCLTFPQDKNKDQCYVILDGAKTINASFNEGSDNKEGKYYDLNVTVSSGGTVATTDGKINCSSSNSPCKYSYGKNGTVTLKATPNSGYVVGDYSGCSKSGNVQNGVLSCKVKMTQKRNVAINFKSSGISSSSSSNSKSSSSSSSYSFATNLKVITNSATNVTSNSATLNGIVNPKDENVSYRFYYVKKGQPETQKTTSWTSVASGSSDVSVTANVSGLSSGTTYNFAISAYSYTSKKFSKIGGTQSFTTSGDSNSSSSSSKSSSSSSQTTASTYKLKVTISGKGRIQDNYSKIDCSSNMACQATYSKGQIITLKTDDSDPEGNDFGTKVESWSGGGCSGTANACFITMDENKEITIKFVIK